MKQILMALCAATLAVSTSAPGFAQGHGRGQEQCQPQDRACLMTRDGKSGHKAAPQKKAEMHKPAPAKGPKIGDSGRKGQPFRQAGNSRFKAPPHGQEYRVVNDRLVLVDKDTLKIVAVLGLLSALTN